MKKLILGLLGLLLATTSAFAYQPGEWVLANTATGPTGTPAWCSRTTMAASPSPMTTVTAKPCPPGLVKNYSWQVGTRVECNWKGGGKWFGGRITALRGGAVSIHYDDGDRENTATGRCRSR